MTQPQPPGTVEIVYSLPDGTTLQRTWGANGSTAEQLIPGPGTPTANQNAIAVQVQNALAQLGTIMNQAQAFQQQSPYATANLANLNDLLTKAQTMAAAVGTLAQDLRYIVRTLTGQYDGAS